MNNAFNSIPDTAKERIITLEDRAMENSQTEMQRGKRMKKWNMISKNGGTIAKDATYV